MKKSILGMTIIGTCCVMLLGGCGAKEPAIRIEEIQSDSVDKTESVQIMECDEKAEVPGDVIPTDVATASTQADATEVEGVPRMLCHDGDIYYDTGRISDALRCGVMDWIVESTVEADETPTESNQSNFGIGYGYQCWGKGQLHVNIDGTWHIFQASEACRLTVTNGNNGERVELERSPVFWEVIEKYQNLDVTAQNKQMDRVGYSYCLRLYDGEDNLMTTVTPTGRELDLDGVLYEDNGYGTVNELYLALDALFEEDFPEATATESMAASERNMQEQNAIQGEHQSTMQGENETDGGIDVLEDVTMTVTYATNKGVNLVLMNLSDKNMQCGDDYELQMLKDGEWYRVDYIIDNWAFTAIAYMMPQNEPVNMCVNWKYFHGILPVGQYRIVKEVMDFRGTGDYTTYRLAAEFAVE